MSRVELTTEDIEIIEDMGKDETQQVKKPVRIIVTRDVYPWYSLFNKDRIRMKAMEESGSADEGDDTGDEDNDMK